MRPPPETLRAGHGIVRLFFTQYLTTHRALTHPGHSLRSHQFAFNIVDTILTLVMPLPVALFMRYA